MATKMDPTHFRWQTRTLEIKRYPFWILGGVCSVAGVVGFYIVLAVMKYPDGAGAGLVELFFPGLLSLIGVVTLLGTIFGAPDTIELNDHSMRYVVRGKNVYEIPFDAVTSVDRDLVPSTVIWIEETGVYRIRREAYKSIPISNSYKDYKIMRAMLAERLPPQLVPEAWQELFRELR
jgi:hypothetical protein